MRTRKEAPAPRLLVVDDEDTIRGAGYVLRIPPP
jgi:hypothetical protein